MSHGLQHRLDAQRSAAARNPCPSPAARRAALGRLEAMLRTHGEPLHRAISSDFGNRARPETILAEILPVLDAVAYAKARLARWMRPRRRPVGMRLLPGRAWIETRPAGCVGIVSPWNYPILLSLMPVVDALAAGNTIMLKPSEQTPACSGLLARLLAEAFEPEQLTVILGDAAIAAEFCNLRFDHLLFTGSTGVGRSVIQAAAANLVPVTLELGGKSPAILAEDAVRDPPALRRTAHSLAVGKFFNAGQTCMAPDYVLTPRRHLLRTAEALHQAATRLYPSVADNPDYTALISEARYRRLRAMLADAMAKDIMVFRHPEDGPANQERLEAVRKFPPTILYFPGLDLPSLNATSLDAPGLVSPVMEEEIFGPLLPVLPYDSIEQAIEFINARPSPLALYCYSDDRACQRLILQRTRSGGATVNGTLLHGAIPSLPFGGIGQSGFGAYHGYTGFLRFSHQRAIYRAGRFSGFTWMSPPHGRLARIALPRMFRPSGR